MPLYEYAPTSGHCEQCAGKFEAMQRIADDKLTQCPTCGQACERQISCVALGGKFSTSEAAVKSSGFTRYQKAENGVYERTAGSGGPETLYRE
jgi:putative FmdB family regulatory protein